MIKLVYTINNAKFRRSYHRHEYRQCIARARQFQENGIPFRIYR